MDKPGSALVQEWRSSRFHDVGGTDGDSASYPWRRRGGTFVVATLKCNVQDEEIFVLSRVELTGSINQPTWKPVPENKVVRRL